LKSVTPCALGRAGRTVPALALILALTWLVSGTLCLHPAVARADLGYSLGVVAEESYNDNVFLDNENTRGDFITGVYPEAKLSWLEKDTTVNLGYRLGWVNYLDVDREFTRHTASLDLAHQASEQLSFSAKEMFYRYETLQEPGLEAIGFRTSLEPYERNTFHPEIVYQFGAESFFTLAYDRWDLWNNDPNIPDSSMDRPQATVAFEVGKHDLASVGYSFEYGRFQQSLAQPGLTGLGDNSQRAHQANMSYAHRVSSDFELRGSYGLEKRNYGGKMLQPAGTFVVMTPEGPALATLWALRDKPGYWLNQPRVGLLWRPREDITFEGQAGAFIMTPDAGETQYGPVTPVSLTKTTSNGSLVASYVREVANNLYDAENLGLYESWRGSLAWIYNLAERLNLNVRGSFGERRYALQAQPRTDSFWNLVSILAWNLRPWLDLGAEYRFTQFDSRGAPNPLKFTQNIALLRVRVSYDREEDR